VIAVIGLWGCVGDGVVPCGDIQCPAGDVCTAGGCATTADVTACNGLADNDACMSANTPRGVCHGGGCRAIACGDNVTDPGEACDDGNTVSGDGCSAACDSNETCGNGVVDGQTQEECDSGRPGLDVETCSSTCKIAVEAWRDITPQPIEARLYPLVAYDPVRKRVVAFGGVGASAYLNDTWELDGTVWNRMDPIVSPPGFSRGSIVYDSALQRMVVFGGTGAPGDPNDTWTWDGVTWELQHPVHSPPQRFGPGMAYDITRNRVVMFGGGNANDLWEYDGTDWTQVTPSTSPPGRYYAQMAFDQARGVIVMYGGYSDDLGQLNDTWTWDGATWTHITGTAPTAHYDASIAYDSSRQRVVLAGGNPGGNETWEWDGATWTQMSTTGLPARGDAGMAFDADIGQSVLLAGYTNAPVSDTWAWNGATWTAMPQPPTSPGSRGAAGVAYDERRGEIVIFGGYDTNPDVTYNDTWIWKHGAWHQTSPSASPSIRSGPQMGYDHARGQVVLFGGFDGNNLSDTWTWDGTTWTHLSPATTPPGRNWGLLVWDDDLQALVMFGGITFTGDPDAGTFAWDGTNWRDLAPTTPFPAGEGQEAGAYDALHHRIITFGHYFADDHTWMYDHTTWTDVSPKVSPPARSSASMFYDPISQRIVMFGGLTNPIRDDTWEWDGTQWSVRSDLVAAPSWGGVIAYDAVERRAVMFSGFNDFAAFHTTLALESTSPLQGSPSERCLSSTHDDDGDGLAGCADPDCWGRCTPGCVPGATCSPSLPRCGDGTCGPIEDHLICPADCP
jgi:cysteine-rich repeat protein